MGSGKPTIVALYVLPEWRQKGVGAKLLADTIDYMIANDMSPIKMDVMSSKAMRIIDSISSDVRNKIEINDQTMGGAMDGMLER
jgi:GNAT superfamily N-acetyltransferase